MDECLVVLVVIVGDVTPSVERCLRSIAGQTRQPDRIVVATGSHEYVRDRLAAILPGDVPWVHIENSRTPGAAGCLNVGLLSLLASAIDPSGCMVAISDGTAAWDERHLERCSQRALNFDVLLDRAGGLGSGPCLRLETLLMAGLFDEDRDDTGFSMLLPRLVSVGARLGELRCPTPQGDSPDAPSGLPVRCATPSPEPQAEDGHKTVPVIVQQLRMPERGRALSLVVGIICGDPSTLAPLLTDLRTLKGQSVIENLLVVVLQNGAPDCALRNTLERGREMGLRCALVTEDRQRQDARRGAFGELRQRAPGQVGIASARTMLQRYLARIIVEDHDSFAWILDDDMRVDDRAAEYLRWLPSFRAAGVDVLIGAHEGSSPNPPLTGLRVQLVDLWHNLEWLHSMEPSGRLPDRSRQNERLRSKYPDYYYDLSRRHTGHLETIHWVAPAREGETVSQALARLASALPGLLSGAPLTRPVVVDLPHDPLAQAKDSVNRGGSTFILNPRAISETPNAAVRLGEHEARRSDMIWALISRHYRGMVIKQVNFPVIHVGRAASDPPPDVIKMAGEIVGSAFYGAFADYLVGRGRHDLKFSDQEIELVCSGVARHMDQRLRALMLSFYRVRGLRVALARHAGHREVGALISHLEQWTSQDTFSAIESNVQRARREDFGEFMTSLRPLADGYANATVDVDFIRDQARMTSS